jgi:hypothetical protein
MAKGKYHDWISEEGLIKLEGWARDGLIDEQIAGKMGIATGTLYEWKKKYPELNEALKKGKEVVDRQVENALLKRALGYSHFENEYAVYEMDEDEYFDALNNHMLEFKQMHPEATDQDIDAERANFPRTKKVLIKQKTKEVVPDTTAQIFWLKNRKPEKWRDKQIVQHDGQVKVSNPFQGLTEEELRRLAYDQDD